MKVSEQIIEHEFVEFIPSTLVPGKLYISIPYVTAAHKCCCGCGEEVVTPFSPTDWRMTFDGRFVSLEPSIGNWSFACKSHYLIINGRVHWAQEWTQELIERGRERDRINKAKHFQQRRVEEKVSMPQSQIKKQGSHGFVCWIKSLFRWK